MALCGEEFPTIQRRKAEWSKVAYTIYVQSRMKSPKHRPTASDWKEAEQPFLDLIEHYRPKRLVVTSLTTWKRMPDAHVQPCDYYCAYRLANGQLVWCMGVPHPSARMADARWEITAWRIRKFQSLRFPTRYKKGMELIKSLEDLPFTD
jgi:hypothetical protein